MTSLWIWILSIIGNGILFSGIFFGLFNIKAKDPIHQDLAHNNHETAAENHHEESAHQQKSHHEAKEDSQHSPNNADKDSDSITNHHQDASAEDSAKDHNSQSEHWQYSGKKGPSEWAGLSPKNKLCTKGEFQSPINISQKTLQSSGTAHFLLKYFPVKGELHHNGHTLQYEIDNDSQILFEQKKYFLKQFHFHSPSEHTVDGLPYPLEVHLVHKADDGSLLVIGMLIDEGGHNERFAKLLHNVPVSSDAESQYIDFDINHLFPEKLKFFNYMGSLTTPPCSEGVQWFVLQKPIFFSSGQIEQITKAIGKSSRPIQKIGDRFVKLLTIK